MRGWPDRLLLWPWRNVLFVEFKRPGEQPRKLQHYVHELIRAIGFEVLVHDNIDAAMAEIKAHVDASTGTASGLKADSGRAWRKAISASGEGEDQRRTEELSDTEEERAGGQTLGHRTPPGRYN